ncbi:hypothetical protein D3C85_1331410 [compost metagenome]
MREIRLESGCWPNRRIRSNGLLMGSIGRMLRSKSHSMSGCCSRNSLMTAGRNNCARLVGREMRRRPLGCTAMSRS